MATDDTVIDRPKLSVWMWERGLKPRHAAKQLGVSVQSARRYCLPFGHPDRRVPPEETMEAILVWTQGEVTVADHYPSHLRAVPTAPLPIGKMAEPAR